MISLFFGSGNSGQELMNKRSGQEKLIGRKIIMEKDGSISILLDSISARLFSYRRNPTLKR